MHRKERNPLKNPDKHILQILVHYITGNAPENLDLAAQVFIPACPLRAI